MVDHSNSENPGTTGVGSWRTVVFGGDELTEDIRGWENGLAYAYSVRHTEKSPFLHHLGVLTFEDDGVGGCFVTWRQFFEPVGFKGKVLAPMVMRGVMKGAMKNLIDEFEGSLVR